LTVPTLDEVRRWARGESVDGMPSRARVRSVDPPVIAGARESKQYKISADGKDALILFGKQFRGKRLSEMTAIPRGRKYILWILDRDFDDAFKAVCRYQMELYKRAK
jgi:hypothetical protein